MTISVQQRTLRRAHELVGGDLDTLARLLVVPHAPLVQWLDARQPIPDWLFLRAVDIINEYSEQQQAA